MLKTDVYEAQATAPTKPPCAVYPDVRGLACELFQLSSQKMPPEQRQQALQQVHAYLTTQKANFLGYQANQQLDFAASLGEYLDVHVNNLGDPFYSGNFTVNSKIMERAVLDYYAALWNAQWPHEYRPDLPYEDWKNSYWGYVVSMGCTEGNIYGLWNGRDYLAGKFLLEDPEGEERARLASLSGRPASGHPRLLCYQAPTSVEAPNAYTPVAFYSQDTHYSIIKAMRVLNMATFFDLGDGKFSCPLQWPQDYPPNFSSQYLSKHGWPFEVPSNGDGSVFIPALLKLVDEFTRRGYPVLICFNYGTTFKGAYDAVKTAVDQLVPILKRNRMYARNVPYDPADPTKYDVRNGFWFHVDGALGAAYMPYLEMAMQQGKFPNLPADFEFPCFDFRIKELHSISMSGHKWIGAPWPCGVYMTKVKYQLRPPDDPMYIGSPDTTFAGSRNGFSAMILWDYLARNSYDSQIDKAIRLETLAAYAYQQLLALQQRRGEDLWVERTPLALTIRFKQANPDIIFTYSLSGEELYVNGHKRAYSHIFIMEHVTEQLIDALISALEAPAAFPPQPAPA